MDGSLGCEKPEPLQEVKDNEILLRMDKMIRSFYSDTKEAIKIIPKKSTMDLEQKLKQKFDRLNLKTEMGIVSILKEKVVNEKKGKLEGLDQGEELNGAGDEFHGLINHQEDGLLAKQKTLQAIEENPKIKEVITLVIVVENVRRNNVGRRIRGRNTIEF